MTEFDYQWKNLPSEFIEYNGYRMIEFNMFTMLPQGFLKGKEALDAGCGNGRYTYAMQELGAKVKSIDVSGEAVKACKKINPNTQQMSLLDLSGKQYDFILCWGVLHHIEKPQEGFSVLVNQLKKGGMLHLMLYEKKTQEIYKDLRKEFKTLDEAGKIAMCKRLGKNIHGWYDALNPKYNHSFVVEDIIKWYEDAGFKDISIASTASININGIK